MNPMRRLAEIFLGVDASRNAICRATAHTLKSLGLALDVFQEDDHYVLLLKATMPGHHSSSFQLIISANDAYFHPTEGGQELLSAYPIVAALNEEVHHSGQAAGDVSSIDAPAAILNEVVNAVIRHLQWPIIVTNSRGQLLLAYRPAIGSRRFSPGAIDAKSPRDAWDAWIEPVPWPTVADYE